MPQEKGYGRKLRRARNKVRKLEQAKHHLNLVERARYERAQTLLVTAALLKD